MKLNLGSGYVKISNFLNVDHDPLVKPDFLVDFESPNCLSCFETSTIDEIKAHHILEHIGDGFLNLMKELYRVCKPAAVIDIRVPHFRSDMQFCDPTHKRALNIEQFLLFSKIYNQQHIDEYNSSSGFGLKLDVDFKIIFAQNIPYPKWSNRFLEMTQEQIQEVQENLNNVFQETYIRLLVCK